MKPGKSKKYDDVYSYFLKDGSKRWRYRLKYLDSKGNEKEKKKSGFTTEKKAYEALVKMQAEIIRGHSRQVEYENMTVGEWFDSWYDVNKKSWAISTRFDRRNFIDDIIKPMIGNQKLVRLDKTTYVRLFINPLLEKYKPSTVQLYHNVFKIGINAAVDDEILTRNRFNKIVIAQDNKELGSENFLTPDELVTFLKLAKKKMSPTFYTMTLLLAYSGLRVGEAKGLTWYDVCFKSSTITVQRTRDRQGSRPPKTRNSFRTIAIDDVLLKQLEHYQVWCIKTKLAYGLHLDKENDYIFISDDGTPVGENVLNYRLRKLSEDHNLKLVKPHTLRHTHATILISQSVPVKTIADRLGNTPAMILDVYAHSFSQLEKQAVQAFGDRLSMG